MEEQPLVVNHKQLERIFKRRKARFELEDVLARQKEVDELSRFLEDAESSDGNTADDEFSDAEDMLDGFSDGGLTDADLLSLV